ncbi:MAG: hypothetical protein GY774_24445 [Planctomycetes bacterium]|nr:hypothetical protein [Planctomycetota bacterium]
MARKTKEQKLKAIHENALREFDTIQEAVKDERMQSLKERRFATIAGAQWEGKLGEQFENKPKFEINKIHLSIIRIINEYRNNRISVDFVSKDGTDADRLADVCDGLLRADEQDSNADEAYDNAFEEKVSGGMGAWRWRAEYEDEEDPGDDRQRARVEPIYDADATVFFGLSSKRQDKRDAKTCFLLEAMPRDDYEEKYDDPEGWPNNINQIQFDWCTPDIVFIAEYFKVEEKSETIKVYTHIGGDEERFNEADLTEEKLKELEATGSKETGSKKIKTQKVHKYLLSGGGVLEDNGYIAGKNIPVVVDYGKRWVIDSIERCMGHGRLAKGSQQLKNMQNSKLAELAAYSGVEKPIVTPEQMAGHNVMWTNDNIKNYPYLFLNPIKDKDGNELPSPPLAYTKPPSIPPAMAALLQITEEDIQDLLGNQQQGEQMVGNIAQGTAELIQSKLDMQTYIYLSNHAKAQKRSGEIWLSMTQELAFEAGRKMKTINRDGEASQIELMRPIDGENGEEIENDLSQAKFNVTTEVGPSSATKKASAVRSWSSMLTPNQDPVTAKVINYMIMNNSEGEGITEALPYFRKELVGMGVIEPTKEEQAEMDEANANVEPSPEDEYLQASAEKERKLAGKAEADTELTQAKTQNTQAKTMEIAQELTLDRYTYDPMTGGLNADSNAA